MTAQKQREIVIEFERVKMIRKRAATMLRHCDGCIVVTDFVSLTEAAALFEADTDDLLRFINKNDCHYHVRDDSNISLCIVSLLQTLKQKNNIRLSLAKGE